MPKSKPKERPLSPDVKSLPPELRGHYTEAEQQRALKHRDEMLAKHNSATPTDVHEDNMVWAINAEATARAEILRLEELLRDEKRKQERMAYGKQLHDVRVHLSEALIEQGDHVGAQVQLSHVPEKHKKAAHLRGEVQSLIRATHEPDHVFCACKGDEISDETHLPAHFVARKRYSIHHKGWVYDVVCNQCGARNLTPKIPDHLNRFHQAKAANKPDHLIAGDASEDGSTR